VFTVLRDADVEKVRKVVEWARAEGREAEISESTSRLVAAAGLSDAEVEALVAERNAAKRNKDFARSDAIRAQLAGHGITLEDTKAGVRWKRK
jgi:cysteinyl-tRNA synthetase